MTSNSCPSKSEIQQIFKRLRSVPANKVCFDCHAKNPTWSSVTYGIFICIDCSGIHRSLGVHLTFVRSTQLDSNWTWQQIRQMQCGGNSNALAFFRQHNCVTTDAQQKYKSRAAQLYRDKLHHLASQALRLHGTKLFIDNPNNIASQEEEGAPVEEEKDFFEAHHKEEENDYASSSSASVSASKSNSIPINKSSSDISDQGPSVEAALSMSPTQASQKHEPRKSTIGQRKPAKKGLGVKKGGLGAQKVKKDFAEIEREVELADQARSKMEEERREAAQRSAEEEAKAMASMRLAYQDLSLETKKTEERLRKMDPKKAAEMERLGMAVASKSSAFKHSAITEMSTIEQEEPRGTASSRSMFSSKPSRDFDDYDSFEGFDKDWRSSGTSGNASKFSGFEGGSSNWEAEFEILKSTSKNPSSKNDEWNNNFEDTAPKRGSDFGARRHTPAAASTSSSDDIQKKYGGAKAISSDMLFGSDASGSGPDANLSRFSGSSSISSAEYFGRQEVTPGSRYGSSFNAPDMDDVKESVRQGVSKVAGRLSNMASGVMNQIQDRYGY